MYEHVSKYFYSIELKVWGKYIMIGTCLYNICWYRFQVLLSFFFTFTTSIFFSQQYSFKQEYENTDNWMSVPWQLFSPDAYSPRLVDSVSAANPATVLLNPAAAAAAAYYQQHQQQVSYIICLPIYAYLVTWIYCMIYSNKLNSDCKLFMYK